MDFAKKNTKDTVEKPRSNVVNVIKGSVISVIISIIALIIFSIILTTTQLTELSIKPVVIGITAISILIGSSLGNIKISGKLKTYPVFYGESFDEQHQDYALTYDAFENISAEAILKINAYKSKLKIYKTDSETNKPIEGVEFNLINLGKSALL